LVKGLPVWFAPCKPGARPTTKISAPKSPKAGTGALWYVGYFTRLSFLKAHNRSHKAQVLSGFRKVILNLNILINMIDFK
jgi:hypothetical protein